MKKYLILLLCVSFAFACKKENTTNNSSNGIRNEDEKPLDVNVVANSFRITDAITKTGNPPSPSTSAGAPRIRQTPLTKQAIISDVIFQIPINLTNLNISELGGVYIQIVGSNKYFDVPVSSINLRKVATSQSSIILNDDTSGIVNIDPGVLEPGTFCVSYCVYNAQNIVSNSVQICYEVEQFGGADFVQGNWSIYKSESFNEGSLQWQTDNYPKSETYTSDEVNCDSSIFYNILGNYNSNSSYFFNIETTSISFKEIATKQIQDKNYVCANNGQSRIINAEGFDDVSGNWSYDEDNNRLIYFLNKSTNYLKNLTDNIIIENNTDILTQDNWYIETFNVTNISANEIKLEYVAPDGNVSEKYYLRK
jgi:hypothetical protein